MKAGLHDSVSRSGNQDSSGPHGAFPSSTSVATHRCKTHLQTQHGGNFLSTSLSKANKDSDLIVYLLCVCYMQQRTILWILTAHCSRAMTAGRAGPSFNSWLVTSLINVTNDVLEGGFNRPRSCALPAADCADSSRAFLLRQN